MRNLNMILIEKDSIICIIFQRTIIIFD